MPRTKGPAPTPYMPGQEPQASGIRGLKPTEVAKFIAVSKRELHHTRWPDFEVLTTLGLTRDCKAMAARLGISKFFQQEQLETRPALTWEFLSTFTRSTNRSNNNTSFTFRLCNATHTLTAERLNDLLDFPDDGGYDNKLTDATANEFWKSITGLTPYSSDARASLIVNPSIRYMHRILSACLFGRGDSAGKVQTVELLYLRRMLLAHADTPNIGYHILRQITRVARSTTGTICVGGMVMRIAEALGLNYS